MELPKSDLFDKIAAEITKSGGDYFEVIGALMMNVAAFERYTCKDGTPKIQEIWAASDDLLSELRKVERP